MLCVTLSTDRPSPHAAALLNPRMASLLARIRRANRPPLHTLKPAAARAAYNLAAEVLDLPRAALSRVEHLWLPAADGTLLAARLYAAGFELRPTLLYLHGGGFMVGGLDTHDSLCRQLALRSGWAVVSLDYRLAPEHRFPTAFDDVWSSLQWLAAEPQRGGGLLGLLAVAGDSAGGTLAATCALLARDHGLPLALQLLITPGTAARADSASHARFGDGFLLDAITIEWFFAHFIANADRDDWRFAPLRADAEGVAPACVILAECDPLVDEGLAYADHLRAAGVPVTLELARGVTHDFIKMGRVLPEASQAMDAAAAALRACFDPR